MCAFSSCGGWLLVSPPVRAFLAQLNSYLEKKNVLSLFLSRVVFREVHNAVEEGNLRCIAMTMQYLTEYVKLRQGVLEGFWVCCHQQLQLASKIFHYLSFKKRDKNFGPGHTKNR